LPPRALRAVPVEPHLVGIATSKKQSLLAGVGAR